MIGEIVYIECILDAGISLSNSVTVTLSANGELYGSATTLVVQRDLSVMITVGTVCEEWILLRAYVSGTQQEIMMTE